MSPAILNIKPSPASHGAESTESALPRKKRTLLPSLKSKDRKNSNPKTIPPQSLPRQHQVGDVVFFNDHKGVIRYIGPTHFSKDHIFCGLELYQQTGKNDGEVDGIRYFQCPAKFGLFVPLERVTSRPPFPQPRNTESPKKISVPQPGFTSHGNHNYLTPTPKDPPRDPPSVLDAPPGSPKVARRPAPKTPPSSARKNSAPQFLRSQSVPKLAQDQNAASGKIHTEANSPKSPATATPSKLDRFLRNKTPKSIGQGGSNRNSFCEGVNNFEYPPELTSQLSQDLPNQVTDGSPGSALAQARNLFTCPSPTPEQIRENYRFDQTYTVEIETPIPKPPDIVTQLEKDPNYEVVNPEDFEDQMENFLETIPEAENSTANTLDRMDTKGSSNKMPSRRTSPDGSCDDAIISHPISLNKRAGTFLMLDDDTTPKITPMGSVSSLESDGKMSDAKSSYANLILEDYKEDPELIEDGGNIYDSVHTDTEHESLNKFTSSSEEELAAVHANPVQSPRRIISASYDKIPTIQPPSMGAREGDKRKQPVPSKIAPPKANGAPAKTSVATKPNLAAPNRALPLAATNRAQSMGGPVKVLPSRSAVQSKLAQPKKLPVQSKQPPPAPPQPRREGRNAPIGGNLSKSASASSINSTDNAPVRLRPKNSSASKDTQSSAEIYSKRASASSLEGSKPSTPERKQSVPNTGSSAVQRPLPSAKPARQIAGAVKGGQLPRKPTPVAPTASKLKPKGDSKGAKAAEPVEQECQTEQDPEMVRLLSLADSLQHSANEKEAVIERAKRSLRSSNRACDALAVLIQYLTNDMEVFSMPELKRSLVQLQSALQTSQNELVRARETLEIRTAEAELQLNAVNSKCQRITDEYELKISQLESEKQMLMAEAARDREAVIEKYETNLSRIEARHEADLEEVKSRHEEVVAALEHKHALAIHQLNDDYTRDLTQTQKISSDSIRVLQDQLTEAEVQSMSLKKRVKELEAVCSEHVAPDVWKKGCFEPEEGRLRTKSIPDSGKVDARNLRQEVESLQCVVEMRDEEIHRLRREMQDADAMRDNLLTREEELNSLKLKIEGLMASLEYKNEVEKELRVSLEEKELALKREKQSRNRLSLEKDSLVWQMSLQDSSDRELSTPSPTSPLPSSRPAFLRTGSAPLGKPTSHAHSRSLPHRGTASTPPTPSTTHNMTLPPPASTSSISEDEETHPHSFDSSQLPDDAKIRNRSMAFTVPL